MPSSLMFNTFIWSNPANARLTFLAASSVSLAAFLAEFPTLPRDFLVLSPALLDESSIVLNASLAVSFILPRLSCSPVNAPPVDAGLEKSTFIPNILNSAVNALAA